MSDLEGAVERAAAILKAWNRRETDLLEANNRYLERARAAETALASITRERDAMREDHPPHADAWKCADAILARAQGSGPTSPCYECGTNNLIGPICGGCNPEIAAMVEGGPGPGEAVEYQARVGRWMLACFTPEIAEDVVERNDRFIEEALELVQANGYSAERAHALVDYVFGRPVGEPDQEVGGVMVTLAALCNAARLDMFGAAQREIVRIEDPGIMAKIKAKQAAKPTGSALPVAATPTKETPDHEQS